MSDNTDEREKQINNPVRINRERARAVWDYSVQNGLDYPAAINQVIWYGLKALSESKNIDKRIESIEEKIQGFLGSKGAAKASPKSKRVSTGGK